MIFQREARWSAQVEEMLGDDILSSVHINDVPGDPMSVRRAKGQDRVGYIFGSRESAGRVLLHCPCNEKVVSRNLPECRGIGDPTPDGVYRDPHRGQFECQLATVGLKGSLGGGNRTVIGDDPGGSRGGHGEHPTVPPEDSHPHSGLRPVYQGVGHDPQSHVHLAGGDGPFPHEVTEGSERQGVHQDANLPSLPHKGVHLLEGVFHLHWVGSVDVEKAGFSAGGRQVSLELLHMLQAGPPVQVDTEDVVSGSGQCSGRGFTKAARRTEDQGPTALSNVFRHPVLLRLEEKGNRPLAWGPANRKRYWCGL